MTDFACETRAWILKIFKSLFFFCRDSTLSKKPKAPLDYSSDTEATLSSKSLANYQRRGFSSGLTSSGLSRIGVTPVSSLRSNSLPRDHRGRGQLGQVSRQQSLVRFDRNLTSNLLGDEDSDGVLSAPEMPSRRGFIYFYD